MDWSCLVMLTELLEEGNSDGNLLSNWKKTWLGV